jgi:hypothetical protein
MSDIRKIPGEKEIEGLGKPGQAAVPQEVRLPHQDSMIEPAQQVERSRGPLAAHPELPFPFYQVMNLNNFLEVVEKVGGETVRKGSMGADALAKKTQLAMTEITLSILDIWSDSIQEEALKQRENSEQQRKENIENERIQAGQRTQEIKNIAIQREEANKIQGTQPFQSENRIRIEEKDVVRIPRPEGPEDVDKAAQASMLLGGLLMAGFAPSMAQMASTTIAPVAQAMQAISLTGIVSLPMAFTGMVALIAAGAVIQSSVLTLLSGAKGKKAINAAFIEAYTQRILAAIKNPEFNQTLLKLYRREGDESKTEINLAQVKLILLSTALVLAYRAEAKWITKEEFADMVGDNPTIQFKPKDARNELIAAFREILGELPAKEKGELMQRLMAYFESRPTVEELLKPNEVAVELFSSQVKALSPA